MAKRNQKKGDVCVLTDPVTKARTWLPLEDVTIITKNGAEKSLGTLLQELDESKVKNTDFEAYKLDTKKTFKKFTEILKILVGQQEYNSLGINEILDNLEDLKDEKNN